MYAPRVNAGIPGRFSVGEHIHACCNGECGLCVLISSNMGWGRSRECADRAACLPSFPRHALVYPGVSCGSVSLAEQHHSTPCLCAPRRVAATSPARTLGSDIALVRLCLCMPRPHGCLRGACAITGGGSLASGTSSKLVKVRSTGSYLITTEKSVSKACTN